ncbi:hypothetical protein HII31_09558 [Pseudocercospora fuligena]|uniref:Uncharacterized protein n=1 Tax=Pseudocercospora fuligena TaxID=685502 RepID=A0A8H6RAR6_9PEZI|nr:hypothetical protein HII31_09558 [Pseudocercospora fuligena]
MATSVVQAVTVYPNPSFDPHAYIAWLQQQNLILFNNGARQYAEVQRLMSENQQLLEDQHGIINDHKKYIVQLLAERDTASSQLDDAKTQLQTANLRVEKYKDLAERRKLHITASKKKIAELEAENAERSSRKRLRNMVSLDSDDVIMYPRKKIATEFRYDNEYGGESWTHVSDTEDDASGLRIIPKEVAERMEELWRRNIYHDTRLEECAFEWLGEWCEDHADRIEQQRARERVENQLDLRKVAREKVDVEGEIRKLKKRLAEQIKKKRGIKRKLIALSDEQRLDASEGMEIGKKLFLFCKTMGYPQYDFRRAHFEFVRSETELVRIYHQVMSAMRVLYQDLVEEPKKADKKFKHRNPSPTKWQVLYLPQPDYGGKQRYPLEEQYASNAKDARMACTALQNLLYSWQQGLLS